MLSFHIVIPFQMFKIRSFSTLFIFVRFEEITDNKLVYWFFIIDSADGISQNLIPQKVDSFNDIYNHKHVRKGKADAAHNCA